MEPLKSLLIAVLLVALIYWIMTMLPLPAIVRTIATVLIVVFFVLYAINTLIPML